MEIKTHRQIEQKLCGKPLELSKGYSKVALQTIGEMAVDSTGLVHGGFIFGQADYAAMIAVNHSNVVLGGAEVKFLKPVKTGELLIAEANITEVKGKKNTVAVLVSRNGDKVFEGTFFCFILEKHVLA